jgi:hypothetical protein
MTTLNEVRKVALSLPESSEQDHHGMNSFRVGTKIFATVPDGQHIRIMVDDREVRAAVAEDPVACQELYWGKRLAGVVVHLPRATPVLLRELLTEAWLRKAPKSLASEFLNGG